MSANDSDDQSMEDPLAWADSISKEIAEKVILQIIKDLNFGFRCICLLQHAKLEVVAIRENWEGIDQRIRDIATKQAITSYCSPFTTCIDENGGKRSLGTKKFNGTSFDLAAHCDLLQIRDRILAHHDAGVAKTKSVTKAISFSPEGTSLSLLIPVATDLYISVLSGVKDLHQLDAIVNNVDACNPVLEAEILSLTTKLHVLPIKHPFLSKHFSFETKSEEGSIAFPNSGETLVFPSSPAEVKSEAYRPTLKAAGDYLKYYDYRVVYRASPNVTIRINTPGFVGEVTISPETLNSTKKDNS